MNAVTANELMSKFSENKNHVLRYCCAATETLLGYEEQWGDAVAVAFTSWVEQCSPDVNWVSFADGWTSFADFNDTTLFVLVSCGCHPKAKCEKCGPIKGKVRGSVYLRRIDDNKYFFDDTFDGTISATTAT